MRERKVTITEDDVRFGENARADYKRFAEAFEKHGTTHKEAQAAGLMRKQEFYAERFLLRLERRG